MVFFDRNHNTGQQFIQKLKVPLGYLNKNEIFYPRFQEVSRKKFLLPILFCFGDFFHIHKTGVYIAAVPREVTYTFNNQSCAHIGTNLFLVTELEFI